MLTSCVVTINDCDNDPGAIIAVRGSFRRPRYGLDVDKCFQAPSTGIIRAIVLIQGDPLRLPR